MARPPNGRTSTANTQPRYPPCENSECTCAYPGMAPCRPRGCAQRRSGPDRACRRRFGHSGAASSRWRFLRVRRRQHDRRASFADPTCRPRASSLKTIGLILIRVRRASGTPRAGFLRCDQSPPEPFGNRCETSEWPILDGGTDGSNPVPSREESANHRFLSPYACDRRPAGAGRTRRVVEQGRSCRGVGRNRSIKCDTARRCGWAILPVPWALGMEDFSRSTWRELQGQK